MSTLLETFYSRFIVFISKIKLKGAWKVDFQMITQWMAWVPWFQFCAFYFMCTHWNEPKLVHIGTKTVDTNEPWLPRLLGAVHKLKHLESIGPGRRRSYSKQHMGFKVWNYPRQNKKAIFTLLVPFFFPTPSRRWMISNHILFSSLELDPKRARSD